MQYDTTDKKLKQAQLSQRDNMMHYVSTVEILSTAQLYIKITFDKTCSTGKILSTVHTVFRRGW